MAKITKKVKSTQVMYDSKLENLHQVLLKKAMGYKIKETSEEFVLVEDELKLNKRKVNIKYYPPDLNAIELIINKQLSLGVVENLTDEELEAEKQKLIKQLKIINNIEKESKEDGNNK